MDTTHTEITTETEPQIRDLNFMIIGNPFNPEETIVELRDYIEDASLRTYLGDLDLDKWMVFRNKSTFGIINPDSMIPEPGDLITVTPIPQGDNGKQILAIILLVILSWFTLGLGGAAGGSFLGITNAFGAYLAAAAVFIGGALLINAVLGPSPEEIDDWEDSPSYGLDGPKNVSTAGIPVPVIIGPYRVGGNIISLKTENTESVFNDGIDPTQGNWEQNYEQFDRYDQTSTEGIGRGYLEQYSNRPHGGEQFLYMLLNAGEGEIEGVELIEINDQPIGNFKRSEWFMRPGVDNQEYTGVFDSTVIQQSVIVVMDTDQSYTQRQTSGDIDRIRVDLNFTAGMYRIRSTGVREETSVKVWVHVKLDTDSTWLNASNLSVADGISNFYTITKNTSEAVRISITSKGLPRGTYDVRVKRTDIPAQNIVRSMTWIDLGEINDTITRYNFTALLGIKVQMDDQLHSIPKVTYIHRGIKLKNWDETTQAFQTTQSDNPAWIVYNFFTNTRWGAGIPEASMDLYAFRDWADQCNTDNLVWHGIFEASRSVWEQVRPVLKVGRASLIRIGTKYSVTIERATEASMTFNNTNIIEGTFAQSWMGADDRANQIEVTYYDKEDGFRPKVTKLVDQAAQDKLGLAITTKMNMFGIDNLDQAEREGQFALNMQALTSIVDFDATMEGLTCVIGQVVNVQHDQPEWGDGGRCIAGSTTVSVNLDRDVVVESGTNQLLVVYNSLVRDSSTVFGIIGQIITINGLDWSTISGNPTIITINSIEHTIRKRVVQGGDDAVEIDDVTGISATDASTITETDAHEVRTTTTTPATVSVLAFSSAFPQAPSLYDKWIFGPVNQNAVEYTVRELGESSDNNNVHVSLLEYNAGIFTTVPGTVVTPYSYTTSALSPVTFSGTPVVQDFLGGSLSIRTYVAVLTWSHTNERYKDALIYISKNGGAFEPRGYYIDSFTEQAENGDVLRFIVIPRSIENILSGREAQTIIDYTMGALTYEDPSDPLNFAIPGSGPFHTNLTWGDGTLDPDITYEIYYIPDSAGGGAPPKLVANATHLDFVNALGYIHSGLLRATEYTYWLRAVRVVDETSFSAWVGGTNGISISTASFGPGVVEITYQATEPSGVLGDIWIDSDDNQMYRHNGASFIAIPDNDIGQAIADAAGAQGTADNKIYTFAQTVAPVNGDHPEGLIETGDLWIDTNDTNKLYRWDGSWTSVVDTDIATAITDASNAQATADGKIVTFIQASAPTAEGVGDIWIDNDDDNLLYRWSGSVWVDVRDVTISVAQADATTGIADAATAQGTADARITTFIQASEPTALATGDIWLDSDDNHHMYRWSGSVWTDVAQDTADWNLLFNVPSGIVEITYQATAPTGVLGDLWIDSDDNQMYRHNGTSFVPIPDNDIGQAITDAAGAQGTADNKIYTFAQTVAPVNGDHPEGTLELGDLWIDTNDTNKLYRWSGSSWDSIVDTDIATAITDASNAQSTADGKIVTFIQGTEPTADGVGDLWIENDNDNKLYRWSGSSWVDIQDDTIAIAQADASTGIADAATAQGTADARITTFIQASSPTALATGDLWLDSDDNHRLYRWSGSVWANVAQETADWALVFGTGQPEDDATVGAPGVPPPDISIGVGSTDIELQKNMLNGSANDGEIDVLAGTYLLPDGTTRVISTLKTILTYYEGTGVPNDGVFFVWWGASDVSARFTTITPSNFGTSEADGIFIGTINRATGQHTVRSDSSSDFEDFTPLNTDIVIAVGFKTATSGGIQNLFQTISVVNNPLATLGADFDVDLSNIPVAISDGRVAAGIAANGDVARAITQAIADSSNFLRFTGGELFVGDLAADITGANTSADTTLVDGTAAATVRGGAVRANAGLDSSGDLGRNILTSRRDSSNLLGRTAGGIYTGALAATENQITSGTATPTGGIAGDLYYETDAKAWWANIATTWTLVGDETAQNIALSIIGQGNLATQDTADFATDVDGAEKPEDNATLGVQGFVPPIMRFGVGSTDIELQVNMLNGSANDGEIDVLPGTYFLPDGTTRVISSLKTILTPYEATAVPPDGVFFIVWGASDVSARFTTITPANLGTSEADGIFPARVARDTGQWTAQSNVASDFEDFTPLDTDIVFAVCFKEATSGGIERLTQLVSTAKFSNNPNLIVDPTAADAASNYWVLGSNNDGWQRFDDSEGTGWEDVTSVVDTHVLEPIGAGANAASILVASSTAYTFSVDIKMTGRTVGTLFVDWIEYDALGDQVADVVGTSLVVDTVGYQRLTFTTTTTSTTTRIRPRVFGVGLTATLVRARRMKFELGNVQTPFSVDQAIANANADLGDTIFNSHFGFYDSVRRAPTGWFLSGAGQQAQLTGLRREFQDGQAIAVLDSVNDNNIRLNSTAFPVNNKEPMFFRLRIRGDVASASGLFIRVEEYSGDLAQGDVAIAEDASLSPDSALLQEHTGFIAIGQEDQAINTSWTEYTTTKYTPTLGMKWASLSILNWTGHGNDEIWIARAVRVPEPGSLAAQDTADFATDVTGSEKPEDNATLGGLSNIIPMGYGTFERISIGSNNYFDLSLNTTFAQVQSNQAKIGTRCLEGLNNGTAGSGCYFGDSSLPTGIYHMPLLPNRRWLVTMWVRVDTATSHAWALSFVMDDGTHRGAVSSVNLASANTWTQMAFVVDLTSVTETAARIRVYSNNHPANAAFFIDGVNILDVTDHPDLDATTFPTEHFQAEGPIGALADFDTVDWDNSEIINIPTAIFDGRVAAGILANGDLNRNILTSRADSSNILRRTAGGLFSGDLNADVTAAKLSGSGVNSYHPSYDVNPRINVDFGSSSSNATPSIVTSAVGGRGPNLIKIVATGADAFVYLGFNSSDYDSFIEPNKKWLMSAWVYGSANSMEGDLYIRTSAGIHYVVNFTTDASANTWSRIGGTAILDLSADASERCIFRIDNDHGSGEIHFDMLMFEEYIGDGTTIVPSAFVPAAGDDGATDSDNQTDLGGLIFNSNFNSIDVSQNRPVGWVVRNSTVEDMLQFSAGSIPQALIRQLTLSDTSVGLQSSAFRPNQNSIYTLIVKAHALVGSTGNGFYIRMAEYNSELVAGKNFIVSDTANPASLAAQCQLEDQQIPIGLDNMNLPLALTTFTQTYIPTVGTVMASVMMILSAPTTNRDWVVESVELLELPAASLTNIIPAGYADLEQLIDGDVLSTGTTINSLAFSTERFFLGGQSIKCVLPNTAMGAFHSLHFSDRSDGTWIKVPPGRKYMASFRFYAENQTALDITFFARMGGTIQSAQFTLGGIGVVQDQWTQVTMAMDGFGDTNTELEMILDFRHIATPSPVETPTFFVDEIMVFNVDAYPELFDNADVGTD